MSSKFIAITRQISPRFNECELTHLDRQPIDLDLARAQHQQYEAALRELGCEVISLPAEPICPIRSLWKMWRWSSTRSPSSRAPARIRASRKRNRSRGR